MMERPQIEIADVFNKFGHLLGNQLPDHHKVMNAIKSCRTEKLGGHALKCNSCDHKKNAYNSCRNRHCPKCQFLTKVKWIEKRKEDLLPCQYFHSVFTIPSELRPLFLRNKKLCYSFLFKASSETLKEVAQSSDHLGADIGFIGVLHTWGQNLVDHPHIHYIVPGGGLNKKKTKWIHCPKDYFLPIKVLSKIFRAKMLKLIRSAYDNNEFKIIGEIDQLSNYNIFNELMMTLASKDWVVYSKKPFAGPEQVINYLGGYTHRIAISNFRLVKIEGEKIFFKVRDKDNPGKSKVISLHVKEFMRRFLLHVLPRGFMRIRHFGILGNRYKKEKIALIRMLENIIIELKSKEAEDWKDLLKRVTGIDINSCKKCGIGEYEVFLQDISSSNSS
jgi:hypothetical protein